MRGLEGRVDHADQVALHGIQVDGLPQPGGEGGDEEPYGRNVP